jgi:hypothetical protein
MPKQRVDDLEFGDHLHELESFLLRREPFALILQLTGSASLGILRHERVRRHVVQHRTLTQQYLLGIALVPHTRLQRAMLRGLVWFTDPPWPTRLFDDLPSALDWAHARTAQSELVFG